MARDCKALFAEVSARTGHGIDKVTGSWLSGGGIGGVVEGGVRSHTTVSIIIVILKFSPNN